MESGPPPRSKAADGGVASEWNGERGDTLFLLLLVLYSPPSALALVLANYHGMDSGIVHGMDSGIDSIT